MRPTRWAFPVASPWTARRYGRPVALLSARQAETNAIIRMTLHWGPRTLEDLARLTDNPSRGGVHRILRRLRQLEIIATHAKRGCHGRTYLWIPRHTRALAGSLRGARFPRVNDSASTPTGSFLSADGLRRAFRTASEGHRGGAPPRTPLPRGRRTPPRYLWGTCPLGHRVRLLRWSWSLTATTLEGRWGAACPRCGRETVEHVQAMIELRPRARTPEELADPRAFERRRAAAAELLADPSVNRDIRERLAVDYGLVRRVAPAGGGDG